MIKQIYLFFISMLCILPAYSANGSTDAGAVREEASEESISRDITLTTAGTLAEALGEEANLVDSLVVRGPINEVDFKTMWSASFHGKLEIINLENAVIETGKLPDRSFWDATAQTYDNYIIPIHLRKIILPDEITEIGTRAFFYASALEEVKLPTSLVKIDDEAFSYCQTIRSLVFPENLEIISNSAFAYCYKLAGDVVLPEKLRILEKQAFYQCAITNIKLPSTLESLGRWAFAGNKLVVVDIPEGCILDSGGCQFLGNYRLERVHLPSNISTLPEAIFLSCSALKDINFPLSLTSIEEEAFQGCESLVSVNLPEGLETIENGAFEYCTTVKEIVFPSSLKSIGNRSFGDTGLKKIYSKAVVPPICTPTTFQGVSKITPLYIPIGTMADYVSAQNSWYYFINMIETDNFPSLSVDDVCVDSDDADAPVYDLMGRRVESPQPGQIYIRAGKKFTVKP